MEQMNRRRFFSTMAKLTGVAVIAPAVLSSVFTSEAHAQRKRGGGAAGAAAGGPPMVDPKDPVAKAVKYIEDHTKVAEAKGNDCTTCSFYKKTETRDGKEAGTCTIFAGKLVYGAAWCSSWNKKA